MWFFSHILPDESITTQTSVCLKNSKSGKRQYEITTMQQCYYYKFSARTEPQNFSYSDLSLNQQRQVKIIYPREDLLFVVIKGPVVIQYKNVKPISQQGDVSKQSNQQIVISNPSNIVS